MASYHLSVQIIRRSKGQSVLAAAAYRSGERLRNDKDGVVHDYRRRQGVVYAEVIIPRGAAAFLGDREKLWNNVEQSEGRRDAQLAREINLALPHELDAGQRKELLLNFVRTVFVSRGMVADVAIHAPVASKGDHPHNHHAHILLTLRQATAAGLRRVKTREWNSDILLAKWRALWSGFQNEALTRAGFAGRVDHRTLEAQRGEALARGEVVKAAGLERRPEIHLGKQVRPRMNIARQSARTAAVSVRAGHNAAILSSNAEQARRRLDAWQRAFVKALQRANKPRKVAGGVGKVKPRLSPRLNVQGDLFGGPQHINAQLSRLGSGMSAWQIILRARQGRQSDFRSRYLAQAFIREVLGIAGRQRFRARPLDAPLIPQATLAAFKPVSDFGRQDRVLHLPWHQNHGPPI